MELLFLPAVVSDGSYQKKIKAVVSMHRFCVRIETRFPTECPGLKPSLCLFLEVHLYHYL